MYMKNNKWRRVVNGFLAALAVLSYQKAGAMAVLTIIFCISANGADNTSILFPSS